VIGVPSPVSAPVGDFNEDRRADIVAVSSTTDRVY
jgi:hypothetical protein